MSIDRLSQPKSARRRTAAIAGLAVVITLGAIVAFRAPIAAYLIRDRLEQAGLSGVSLTVSRLGIGGIAIENLEAEGGALTVASIEATYTLPRLLRTELESLTIGQARATLAWDAAGFKLGAFPLRIDPNAPPLTLPVIDTLRAENALVEINTPAMALNAPLSVSARRVAGGWETNLDGRIDGQGVNIAAQWAGLLTPADLARSTGRGRFDLQVDDFSIPETGDLLGARGIVSVNAAGGAFTVTVDEPLALSVASLVGATAGVPALQDFGKRSWTLTVAPSQSNAAFVVTAAGEHRSIRFDLAATAQGGDSRADIVLVGEAARTNESTTLQIRNARADIANIPFGGGMVAGHFALADFAGTPQAAQGHVDATVNVAGVTIADTKLDAAQASLSSTIRVADGTATFDIAALRASIDRASLPGWTLAAPTELTLAKQATAQPHVMIGALGKILSADMDLALPVVSLKSRDDDSVQTSLRLPSIKIKAAAKGLAVSSSLNATNVSLDHPLTALRHGRLDVTKTADTLTAKADASFVRLGPADDSDPAAGALTTRATLTTRGGDYDIRGTFATAAGAKLGDYTARTSADFARGTATLSIPKTKFERGGKHDAADLAFISPVTDLSGTLGLEAKTTWNGDRRSGTALATLDDVSFAVGDISIVGLTTAIDLGSLQPPRSSAPHRLVLKSVTAGIPLTNGALDFTLPGDGTAGISRASIDVAGGQITMTDESVPIDGRAGGFALDISKIDMAALAALAQVDGLSIVGTLSGQIPLNRDETGLHFAEGLLRADAPGRLAYKPATPPAALSQSQGGALLVQALSNFAYDRMSITVTGPVMDDITLAVTLAGKNPDLYGGYPIEFNLNLSGRLTQILQQGFVGAGIPADLERQLREGKHP